MNNKYILRELDKAKIKDRSGMCYDQNLQNILQEIGSGSDLNDLVDVQMHEKEMLLAFSVFPAKDYSVRLDRVTKWGKEFLHNKNALTRTISFQLHVLFDEIDELIFCKIEELPHSEYTQKQLKDLAEWTDEYIRFYTTDPVAFDNTKVSQLIYSFMELVNKHLQCGCDKQDAAELLGVVDTLELLSLDLLQFATYVLT